MLWGPPLPAAMDAEALDELAGQLHGEALGGRGLLQLAATTGLAAYAVWAAVLMPGFRRVPLRLQVPPKAPPGGIPSARRAGCRVDLPALPFASRCHTCHPAPSKWPT